MSDPPASNDPSPIPDLDDEAERWRLGPYALKAFSRIMIIWEVPVEDAGRLLALEPGTAIDDVDPAHLGKEQLLRISCFVGVYKGLHTLWGDKLADSWIRMPNSNAIFCGQAPLDYIIRGGIDALRTVRNRLDSRCAGN